MRLYLDTADINQVKRFYELFPIDGVSCNPTILTKSGEKPYSVLKEIRREIGDAREIFVQVVSKETDKMIKEANRIVSELGPNTIVKFPCCAEGYRAINYLRDKNVKTVGTTIYNTIQGYLAAKAGALYVAPYVNRIDNMGSSGVQITKDIHDILSKGNYKCTVLAASFKNTEQVLELAKYGIPGVTVGPEVLDFFLTNVALDIALENFKRDFEKYFGKDKDMSNI